MKKYLLGQWLGISFIHWLIAPPWGIYLMTHPLLSGSFYQMAIALWVFLSSLILCFWTIYLLGCHSRPLAKYVMRFRFPVFRVIYVLGQATALLITLMGAVRLLPGFLPDEEVFRLPDRSGFWIMQSIAIAQGLHHFFYKFVSGSPSRCDGLLDRIGRSEAIDWQYLIGGSIGVEMRRLRRLQPTRRLPRY